MAKKYTVREIEKESKLLYWVIINAITKVSKEVGDTIIKNTHQDHGKMDIKLVVSGVELPLMKTFNVLETHLDRMIKVEAHEMVDETMVDLEDHFNEICEWVEKSIKKKFKFPLKEEY